MTEQEIRDLFRSKNVPLERDDVWSVQAARVVRHKALERLAAALNITYDPPQILRNERDEAVILVTGRLGERSEWSIGEALTTDGSRPGNYKVVGKQAPYVYAMAEKRAKDRVILKLAGLHGAYSEDEADDFQRPITQAPTVNPNKTPEQEERQNANRVAAMTGEQAPTESQKLIFAALGLGIEKASTIGELVEFRDESIKPQMSAMTTKQQAEIEALYKDRYRSLQRRAA